VYITITFQEDATHIESSQLVFIVTKPNI